MRVGVVVDDLEETRQVHAPDNDLLFTEVRELLAVHGLAVEFELYRNESHRLLAALRDHSVGAVVFTSNSLRHPDSDAVSTLTSSPDAVPHFLSRGGGVLVLHQYVGSGLPVRLVEGNDLKVYEESHADNRVELAADDVLLNFPVRQRLVDHRGIDQVDEQSRPTSPSHWLCLSHELDDLLQPVITSSTGHRLLARSPSDWPGRLVVSALPLDWQWRASLLANCVRFLLAGSPTWAIWLEQQAAHSSPPFPWPSHHAALPTGSESDDWLRRQPIAHLMASRDDLVARQHDYREAVRSGGVLLGLDVEQGGPEPFGVLSAVVGTRHDELRRTFREAIELDSPHTTGLYDPIPARNLVEAHHYFETSGTSATLRNQTRASARSVLRAPHPTLGSVMAVSASLLAVGAPRDELLECVKALAPIEQGAAEQHAVQAAGMRLALEDGRGRSRATECSSWCEAVTRLWKTWTLSDLLRLLECASRIDDASTRTLARELVAYIETTSEGGLRLSTEGACNLLVHGCPVLSPLEARDFLSRVASMRARLEAQRESPAGMPPSKVARIAHALAVAEAAAPQSLLALANALSAPPGTSSDGGAPTDLRVGRLTTELANAREQIATLEREADLRRAIWSLGALVAWFLLLGALTVLGIVVQRALTLVGLVDYSIPLAATASLACLVLASRRLERTLLVPRFLTAPLSWIAKRLNLAA